MSAKCPPPPRLRDDAEARLARAAPDVIPAQSADKLLHELQVHQIELEMQNEALRQAQIALEESRDRYVDLYEFAPVGYCTLTREGLIAEINLTGAAFLGAERKGLIQRRFGAFVAPEDGDRWHRMFLRAMQRDTMQSCEMELRRGDGSRFHAQANCVKVLMEGEIPAVRIVLADITERKQAEAARVAALAEAERLARLKNEFLANMSHEIRTPLNGVLNLALIGRRDSDADSAAHAAFARIHDAGRHLLAVVNDVLDFSKIAAGKLAIEQVAIDPGATIDRAAEFAAEKARAKGLAFRLHKAADLPAACLGDPLRLTQILVNLLDNAVKFSDRGSVALTAGRDAERLVFQISDTGIGMSEEQVGRLFSAFEQADGSTTRRFGGSGLGLAIGKHLVDLMDGEIRVDSVAGAGTRFEVRLPLVEVAPPASAAGAGAAPSGRSRLAGIAILAAEDDAVNRVVLEELIGYEGARLTCVDNGLLAIEQVEREGADAWDLVLMDIQMPVMDGHAAARRLLELAPELPIIGLTAHAVEGERDKCLACGMVEHVAKPFDLDSLVDAILRHIRRRKTA